MNPESFRTSPSYDAETYNSCPVTRRPIASSVARGSPCAIATARRSNTMRGQKHRDRVAPFERRSLVKICVVERTEHGLKRGCGPADIHNDAIGVGRRPSELNVDDVGGTVQPLRGPERFFPKTVRDHDVPAYADAVHTGQV
jgi:hypothetical protein